MKFIDLDYDILLQQDGIKGMFNHIEQIGRLCYKSTGTRYFALIYNEDNIKLLDQLGFDADDVYARTDDVVYEYFESDKSYMCFSCTQKWLNKHKDFFEAVKDYELFGVIPEYGCFYNLSSEDFAAMLEKNGHGAMLEHGAVYLTVPFYRVDIFLKYAFNKYSRCKFVDGDYLITTNYRVIVEKGRKDDLKYFNKTVYHYDKKSVLFTMDRIGSQSICRHRGRYGVSFAQESTRYCDYTKDKFGKEIKFCIPRWIYEERERCSHYIDSLTGHTRAYLLDYDGEDLVKQMTCESRAVAAWYDSCERSEKDYQYLRADEELNPEEARGVLNFSLATQIVMTAFDADWKHFFELRDDSHAHPDMRYIARRLHNNDTFRGL